MATTSDICAMCKSVLGKYMCPRCNCFYCSLSCYQDEKHIECSENFYKDCVVEGLGPQEQNVQNEVSMLKILKTMHDEAGRERNECCSDDEYFIDLAQRLQNVNLNDANQVWEQLNTNEKQEFQTLVSFGNIKDLIKQWTPWWSKYFDGKVIDLEHLEKCKKECPELIQEIKSFDSIRSKVPSERVTYNLVNILTAYVFTMRYFNGEHCDNLFEVAACISKLSSTLNTNENFGTFSEAIESVKQELLKNDVIMLDEENISLINVDVECLMKGPHCSERKFYILSALSDLVRLFDKAIKWKQIENPAAGPFNKMFPEAMSKFFHETRQRLKLHSKKLYYYLSFVKDVMHTLDP